MPNFKWVIQKLRLDIRAIITKKTNVSLSDYKNTCEWDKSANKLELCLPEKGWRLIDRIYIDHKVGVDEANRIEFDEELLERIDFFACLFNNRRKIW